jgi:GrpB protein
VPGLAAKQLIDIQVVVADLPEAAQVAEAARRSGFVRVPGRWFGTDQHGVDHPEEVVVDADPARPVNINIRPVTAPIWRETLLLRDWLRSHDDERNAYAELKVALTVTPTMCPQMASRLAACHPTSLPSSATFTTGAQMFHDVPLASTSHSRAKMSKSGLLPRTRSRSYRCRERRSDEGQTILGRPLGRSVTFLT